MTDAGWVAGKNIIQQGYYWYRDFEQDTQPDVIMVDGDGSEIEPFIVRWECADDELVENMTGQFLGPISPDTYHQGRVAGLRDCEKELNRLAQRDSDYEDDIDGITEWVRSHIEQAQGEQP